MQLFNTGQSNLYSKEVNTKIRIANIIAFIAFIICSLYMLFFSFILKEGFFAMSIAVFVFVFSHFLMRINLHAIARVFIIFGAVFSIVSGVALLFSIKDAISWSYPFLFGAILTLPFILFDSKEKFFKWVSLVIVVLASVSFPYLQEIIEIPDFDNAPFVGFGFQTVQQLTGVLLAIIFLQINNSFVEKSEEENESLLLDLLHKTNDLKQAEIDSKKLLEEVNLTRKGEEKRNWQNLGINELLSLSRKNQQLQKLFDDLLEYIVNYTNANQGGLFIKSQTKSILELKSMYAYEKRKFAQKEIGLKETLVGQCFLEKEMIYLLDVPQNYVNITSGLGEATPECIIILPLKQNENVVGVIEMAYFRNLEDFELDFLNRISFELGAVISNIQISENVNILLAQSKEQEEMLRNQEEELRQNLEEMHATQEELLRKEENYIQKIAALEEELSKYA